MITAEDVKMKIRALIDRVNDVTGQNEPELRPAVENLIAKYNAAVSGGGSGDGGNSKLYIGEITPGTNMENLTIHHGLNAKNILMAGAWARDLGAVTPTDSNTLAKFWSATRVPTLRGGNGFSPGYTWNSTGGYAGPSSPISAAYETLTILDNNTVQLPRATSGSLAWYLAGVTYTVVVVAE